MSKFGERTTAERERKEVTRSLPSEEGSTATGLISLHLLTSVVTFVLEESIRESLRPVIHVTTSSYKKIKKEKVRNYSPPLPA